MLKLLNSVLKQIKKYYNQFSTKVLSYAFENQLQVTDKLYRNYIYYVDNIIYSPCFY